MKTSFLLVLSTMIASAYSEESNNKYLRKAGLLPTPNINWCSYDEQCHANQCIQPPVPDEAHPDYFYVQLVDGLTDTAYETLKLYPKFAIVAEVFETIEGFFVEEPDHMKIIAEQVMNAINDGLNRQWLAAKYLGIQGYQNQVSVIHRFAVAANGTDIHGSVYEAYRSNLRAIISAMTMDAPHYHEFSPTLQGSHGSGLFFGQFTTIRLICLAALIKAIPPGDATVTIYTKMMQEITDESLVKAKHIRDQVLQLRSNEISPHEIREMQTDWTGVVICYEQRHSFGVDNHKQFNEFGVALPQNKCFWQKRLDNTFNCVDCDDQVRQRNIVQNCINEHRHKVMSIAEKNIDAYMMKVTKKWVLINEFAQKVHSQ